MLITTVCPNCGGKMEVDDSREKVFCSYCGTEIINAAEKVEINQNINVTGTVTHKIDRSDEPNLYISYQATNVAVQMVTKIMQTGQTNIYLNGQKVSYKLQPGRHAIQFKIGKKTYSREVVIQDGKPVNIYCTWNGHAHINIDQPVYSKEAPVRSEKKHRPWYTRWWLWLIFAVVLISIISSISKGCSSDTKISGGAYAKNTITTETTRAATDNKTSETSAKEETTEKETETAMETITAATEATTSILDTLGLERKNAVFKAESYLDFKAFSRAGLFRQLTSEYGEKFPEEDAEFAISYLEENGLVNWNDEAVESAQSYLDYSGFSRNGLYNQLTSEYGEQFTSDEANYAIDYMENNSLVNWSEEAIESAQNYLDYSGFSKNGLFRQLTSEYGDGYTSDEATYAIDYLESNNLVNWKEEAVESAENYLKFSSFSRDGLYQQLTSEYGEGFTAEEAEYALSQVGF